MSTLNCDCLIIGGGVIGLTTALKLAEQGASVAVLERGRVGQEASWAGAGMLPPGNLSRATTAEARLRSLSYSLWPDLSESLRHATGIDNGYRTCGSVLLEEAGGKEKHRVPDIAETWQAEEVRFEILNRSGIQRHTGELAETYQQGVFLPDYAQVRNPRHLKALQVACGKRGVLLADNIQGLQFGMSDDRVQSVTWHGGRCEADRVCVAAGAWTGSLLRPLGIHIPVHPVRGQIVQLRTAALPFECIIEVGRRYLVPRNDGLILVGSTEEHVGFAKQTTSEAVAELIQFAISLVPALRNAEVACSWAGLRPGSPDELPMIGRVPGFQNLFVGAGHFRSGLQMSPGTAVVLADLLQDRVPAIPLEGFACDRFGEAGSARDSRAFPPALES